jgi:hypothetical protein
VAPPATTLPTISNVNNNVNNININGAKRRMESCHDKLVFD